MRLTAKKKAEYQEIVRAWLDENGPATKEEIAIGLGWSDYDTNKPCEFGPGSQEKIMVLAKRYADGVQQLWDPRDAGFEAFGSDQPQEEEWDYDD